MVVRLRERAVRWEKAMSYKSHMYGHGKSSAGIVPTKQPNEGQGGPQEVVEGRLAAKEIRGPVEPRTGRSAGRVGPQELAACVERLRFPVTLRGGNRVR